MPDVNLLHDTEQPVQPRPKKPSSGRPEMTDPDKEPTTDKQSVSSLLRSFLGKKPKLDEAPGSKISLERGGAGQRILKDSVGGPAALVPLPDEDDFNVNLLTEDVAGGVNVRLRLIQLSLIALGSAMIVTIAYIGLRLYQGSINQHVLDIQAETASIQKDISGLQSELDRIELINGQLTTLRGVIDKHVKWTNFFKLLESYTLSSVLYGDTFVGTITKSFSFSAKTDSYESLVKQYLLFKQAVAAGDFITDFKINGAVRTIADKQTVVNFNVTLEVKPSVFRNSAPPENPKPVEPQP